MLLYLVPYPAASGTVTVCPWARDPKTVRAYLAGARTPGVRSRSAPDSFARYQEYVAARLRDDPHVWATALFDEVRALGYERSSPRFTHQLRARSLRLSPAAALRALCGRARPADAACSGASADRHHSGHQGQARDPSRL